ncbi:unnamed protein product, partial [Prorocentrum cordatum]
AASRAVRELKELRRWSPGSALAIRRTVATIAIALPDRSSTIAVSVGQKGFCLAACARSRGPMLMLAGRWTSQLVQAVSVLHRRGIAHLCIGPSTVDVTMEGDLVLGDNVGKVQLQGLLSSRDAGSGASDDLVIWYPKEVHDRFVAEPPRASDDGPEPPDIDGPAVDAWQAGVVVFYMLTGGHPFGDLRDPKQDVSFFQQEWREDGAGNRRTVPEVLALPPDLPPPAAPRLSRRAVSAFAYDEGGEPTHERRNKLKEAHHTLVAFLRGYHPALDHARQLAPFLNKVYGSEVPESGLPEDTTWDGKSWAAARVVGHLLRSPRQKDAWAAHRQSVASSRGPSPFRHDLAVLASFIASLDSGALAAASIATLADQDPSAAYADEVDIGGIDYDEDEGGGGAASPLPSASPPPGGAANNSVEPEDSLPSPESTGKPPPCSRAGEQRLTGRSASRSFAHGDATRPLVDPFDGGRACKELMGNVDLDGAGEAPAAKISRLQKTLGGVFSSVWHACARKHPAGANGPKSDPARNPVSTRRNFLDAWRRCGHDAHEMDRRRELQVNWGRERNKRRPAGAGHVGPGGAARRLAGGVRAARGSRGPLCTGGVGGDLREAARRSAAVPEAGNGEAFDVEGDLLEPAVARGAGRRASDWRYCAYPTPAKLGPRRGGAPIVDVELDGLVTFKVLGAATDADGRKGKCSRAGFDAMFEVVRLRAELEAERVRMDVAFDDPAEVPLMHFCPAGTDHSECSKLPFLGHAGEDASRAKFDRAIHAARAKAKAQQRPSSATKLRPPSIPAEDDEGAEDDGGPARAGGFRFRGRRERARASAVARRERSLRENLVGLRDRVADRKLSLQLTAKRRSARSVVRLRSSNSRAREAEGDEGVEEAEELEEPSARRGPSGRRSDRRGEGRQSLQGRTLSEASVRGGADSQPRAKRAVERKPGEITLRALDKMMSCLRARGHGSGDLARPVMVAHFAGVSPPSCRGKLSARNEQEMRMLSGAVDSIILPDLGRATDLLIQQFKAVEKRRADWGSRRAAGHLGVAGGNEVSVMEGAERRGILEDEKSDMKCAKLQSEGKGRDGGMGKDSKTDQPKPGTPAFFAKMRQHAAGCPRRQPCQGRPLTSPVHGRETPPRHRLRQIIQPDALKGSDLAEFGELLRAHLPAKLPGVGGSAAAVPSGGFSGEGCGRRAWLECCVVALNAMWLEGDACWPELWALGKGPHVTAARVRAFWTLERRVEAFLGLQPEPLPSEPASTFLASRSIGYTGERGLAIPLREAGLLKIQSKPLLNGLFGVPKSQVAHRDERGLPRLGGVDDLMEDFYFFRLPDAWAPLFAFDAVLDAASLGLGAPFGDHVYLGAVTMPMGCNSAMGLVQYVHRRMLSEAELGPSPLPRGREARKDRSFPALRGGSALRELWQGYCDDADYAEFARQCSEPEGGFAAGARDCCARRDVPLCEQSGARVPSCQRLGALVDGRDGRVRAPSSRAALCAQLAAHLIAEAVGRRERGTVFRRLRRTIVHWGGGKRSLLPTDVCADLALALSLLPLLEFDLRAPVDSMITASDASERGGGACWTRCLRPGFRDSALPVPAQGRGANRGEGIELFGGIGGGRMALERLGIEVSLRASAEVFEPAKRVVQRRWSNCVELGGVRSISAESLRVLLARGPHLRVLFVLGGSPCQGVARVNVAAGGWAEARAQPVGHIPRVAAPAREARPGLVALSFAENASSISEEDRRHFAGALGSVPIELCASGCSPEPPIAPADLASTGPAARARWGADQYRYAPCQYKFSNVVYDRQGYLRPLTSEERAVRLGFPAKHCLWAVPTSAGLSDREVEDVRCGLYGNTFSVPAVATLLGHGRASAGALARPPTIVQCWGAVNVEAGE